MSDIQKLIDSFSPVYSRILPSIFQEDVPREKYATCSDCAMCPKPDHPTYSEMKYFNPVTKCCTFFPILPNYLVGELLSSNAPERAEGQKRIREVIQNKVGVYPHGIFPPPDYFARYAHDQEDGFGKREDLLCPFYIKEGGMCGVYKSWNSYCSTFYCRQVAGKDGKAFWDHVKEYFIYAENILSKHALRELGFPAETVLEKDMEFEVNMMKYHLQKALKKPFTKPNYNKLWGTWNGREEDLYKASYQAVKNLDADQFAQLGGSLQQSYQDQIKDSLENMRHPNIPALLKKHPKLVIEWDDDGYANLMLVTQIRVPKLIVDILDFFDGKKTIQDVKTACSKQLNANLHDDVIKTLYQQKVLIPIDED